MGDCYNARLATGETRYDMTGAERVLLYATAIQTGLRSAELRQLTRGRIYLDAPRPYVTCKSRDTKNKNDAKQYIKPELANALREHAAIKSPKGKGIQNA